MRNFIAKFCLQTVLVLSQPTKITTLLSHDIGVINKLRLLSSSRPQGARSNRGCNNAGRKVLGILTARSVFLFRSSKRQRSLQRSSQNRITIHSFSPTLLPGMQASSISCIYNTDYKNTRWSHGNDTQETKLWNGNWNCYAWKLEKNWLNICTRILIETRPER